MTESRLGAQLPVEGEKNRKWLYILFALEGGGGEGGYRRTTLNHNNVRYAACGILVSVSVQRRLDTAVDGSLPPICARFRFVHHDTRRQIKNPQNIKGCGGGEHGCAKHNLYIYIYIYIYITPI